MRVYGPAYDRIQFEKNNSDVMREEDEIEGADAEEPKLGPRARKKLGLDQEDAPKSGVYNYDITSLAYRLEHSGTNPYKCTFNSPVSRSPRTNPIQNLPETQKAENDHLGPGYYNI